ncbi:MAG: hypothetical protein HGA45_33895 [Chloroflexales bacterium]|nr:hypothetical protein [Chloroflexales bacterium]
MAQGTEPIRQDIDEIRGSMAETLEEIEARVRGTVDSTVGNVRQAFDLKHQVNEHPWLSLGLAVVAGYMLGNMDGDDRPSPRYGQPGQAMRYYAEPGDRPAGDRPAGGGSDQNVAPSSGLSSKQDYSQYGQREQGGMFAHLAGPIGDELQTIAIATVKSATRLLRESLQSNIPEFETEYQRLQSERASSGDPNLSPGTSPSAAATGGTSYGTRPGMSQGDMGGYERPSSPMSGNRGNATDTKI